MQNNYLLKTTPDLILAKFQWSIQQCERKRGLFHTNKHLWVRLIPFSHGKAGLDEPSNINNRISTSVSIWRNQH